MIQHDVVIVGSGIAGMRCALEIKRKAPSADVALVTKLYPTRAPSVIEREGIAGALGNVKFADGVLVPSHADDTGYDTPALHAADTLKYAEGLADPEAVEFLCAEAPSALYELEHMGLPFSRTATGRIDQHHSWGHTVPRVAFAADRTGHALVHTLYGELVRFGIKVYPEWFALRLIQADGVVQGVVALDIRSGQIESFAAHATVLATGSYGRVFGRTAATQSSTGDGLALAYMAGLPLQNIELVQYHPLGLYPHGFVLSERVLLDGAHLLNGQRERLMTRYAAKELEGAPLARISAAIEYEIEAGRGAGPHKDHVWLDLRHIPASFVRERYPHILEYAADYLGLNPFEQLIPVRPTVAATLGGIPTNLDGSVVNSKRQEIAGLYAIGSCASNGATGANLLPGNRLLSSVVFGRHTGRVIAERLSAIKRQPMAVSERWVAEAANEIDALMHQTGEGRVHGLRERFFDSMSASVGALRHSEMLSSQVGLLHDLRADFNLIELSDKGRVFNNELIEALELARMLDWSEALISGARLREESRGVYSRGEFAEAGTPQHSLAVRQPNGTPELTKQDAPDVPAPQV